MNSGDFPTIQFIQTYNYLTLRDLYYLSIRI